MKAGCVVGGIGSVVVHVQHGLVVHFIHGCQLVLIEIRLSGFGEGKKNKAFFVVIILKFQLEEDLLPCICSMLFFPFLKNF